ncbi:MAG: type II secretion system protein GspC [Steroidobacteraceae bacterium]
MPFSSWSQTLRSPEALASLLQARGPMILAVLLALGIGGEIARLLTQAFGATAAAPVSAADAGYSPPALNPAARTVDLLALANAHLFGQAASTAGDGASAPQTSLPLVLAGVLAADDPDKGYAIVGESAAAARLHAVGASLPGGARLHAVYPDRIVIDRGGNLESLTLPKQPLAGVVPPPPAIGAAAGLPEAAERVRQTLQQDPGALSKVLRMQQVVAGGRQRGFRVYPGTNPSAFSRLGLRPGDLITEINGTPLDDPARGEEIMRTLGSAPQVRVIVVRNGRQNELVLDMAQVANEAQQLVNPDGTNPADPQPAPPPAGAPGT